MWNPFKKKLTIIESLMQVEEHYSREMAAHAVLTELHYSIRGLETTDIESVLNSLDKNPDFMVNVRVNATIATLLSGVPKYTAVELNNILLKHISMSEKAKYAYKLLMDKVVIENFIPEWPNPPTV